MRVATGQTGPWGRITISYCTKVHLRVALGTGSIARRPTGGVWLFDYSGRSRARTRIYVRRMYRKLILRGRIRIGCCMKVH